MRITANHWIESALQLPSPNLNERPDPDDIALLVIHGISLPPGEFGGSFIADLFCNKLNYAAHPYFLQLKELQVSAHLLIRRTGELIQFVPFDKRAWHAGISFFQGRENCNDFSIGIELEGTDDLAYTEAQYIQLAKVVKNLLINYPAITQDRIVGHSDVAPGRKTDPGPAFAWSHFFALLQLEISEEGLSR